MTKRKDLYPFMRPLPKWAIRVAILATVPYFVIREGWREVRPEIASVMAEVDGLE